MILVKNKREELYLYAEYEYKKIKEDKNLEIIKDRIETPVGVKTRRVSFKSVKNSIEIFEKLTKKRKEDLELAKSTLDWLRRLKC